MRLTVQAFFHQYGIEGLVACVDAGVIDHDRPFGFGEVCVTLRAFLHGLQRANLMFQVVALTIDDVDRLLADRILLLLLQQRVSYAVEFALQFGLVMIAALSPHDVKAA